MIKVKEINLSFGEKEIFKRFSMEIRKGEKVLIEGESGSGKSTLLKIILGFENSYSGELYFDGELVNKKNIWKIRGRSSYVSQNLDIGEGNVSKFIDEVFALKANKANRYKEETLQNYLDIFDLKNDIVNKNIEELSGGERQRIAIVVSLLLGREVFLLDEITAALDTKLKDKVVEFFINNRDITVIAVSHDMAWKREGVRVIKIS